MKNKNTLIIFLLVIVILAFSGCSPKDLTENNFPGAWQEDFYNTMAKAETDLAQSIIKNPNGFRGQATLVAYTIEKDTPFGVTFLYAEDGGAVKELPTIYGNYKYMNSYEYRELAKAELFENALKNIDEYGFQSGEVVATILEWGEPGCEKSLCDLDGNGTWDYLAKDQGYFAWSSNPDYPTRVINGEETKFVSNFDAE